ncbi:NADAR family protein [Anatilimnocola floriformis]|uniref:NADAR family protein n=1 Tax=Anatilimnocola floriformis TaxID=2948575 RepID=UPI0020C3CB1E|nr:NADAR family protein [Anatilimnocola floriformis]
MAIEFYSKTTAYNEFSNFSPHGIEMEAKWYPTIEHYFQAMKFPGDEQAEKIRLAKTPAIAKKLGRTRDVTLRSDWEEVKIDIMRQAVRKKFRTHRQLTELLLETGEEPLVEAAPMDYFWGRGRSGSGKNWLGKILMEVREELRTQVVSE